MSMVSTRIGRFAIGVLVLLTLVAVASNAEQFETNAVRTPAPRSILPIEASLAPDGPETVDADNPIEVPTPVVIGAAIALGVAVIYLLSRQKISLRLRRPSLRFARSQAVALSDDEQAETIAEFARDLIEELNDGDSPRYAIQRAYAAVETGFGASELARRPAETPLRYLDRIFGRHQSIKAPLEDLTRLFQSARFSDEPIDESMREAAIDALREIRDYYTRVSWNRIAKRRSKVAP